MDQTAETFDLDGTARYIGVSRPTVRAALRSGRIPALKLGRRWIVARATLDRLLAGELHGTPTDTSNRTDGATIGEPRR